MSVCSVLGTVTPFFPGGGEGHVLLTLKMSELLYFVALSKHVRHEVV